MLIAADSGQLPLDELVLSVVHPSEPRPDVAMVMRPTTTEHLFNGGLRIIDIGMANKKENR